MQNFPEDWLRRPPSQGGLIFPFDDQPMECFLIDRRRWVVVPIWPGQQVVAFTRGVRPTLLPLSDDAVSLNISPGPAVRDALLAVLVALDAAAVRRWQQATQSEIDHVVDSVVAAYRAPAC